MLARYSEWATARLLDAVALLSESECRREAGLFFHSIHGTLNHLLVGEHHLWFMRFTQGLSPQVQLDAEVEHDRYVLDAQLRAMNCRWEPWIAQVPAAKWDGLLHYTTMRGKEVALPFTSTLTHVFNHATHHRGQITAALTAMGQPCPELDMVYYLQAHQEGVA